MTKLLYPNAVSGYELNPNKGYFAVLEPVESTNIIENPSVEYDDDGWSAVPSAPSQPTHGRTADESRRGAYSFSVTPGTLPAYSYEGSAYLLPSLLDTNTVYTVSADFKCKAGQKFMFYLDSDTLGTPASAITNILTFYSTGFWQRISLTFNIPTGGGYLNEYIVIVKEKRPNEGLVDSSVMYVDGLQLEQLGYPTTYFDGDSENNVIGIDHYLWNGIRHASSSWRSPDARNGGKIIYLKDIGFDVLSFSGLGKNAEQNIMLPQGLPGGSYYQRSIPNSREYSIVGAMSYDTYQGYKKAKAYLQELFTREELVSDQPVIVRFQDVDDCGNPIGEPLHLPSIYAGGLEDNIDNLYQERFPITCVMPKRDLLVDGDQSGNVDGNAIYDGVSIHYTIRKIYDSTDTTLWDYMDGGLQDAVRTWAESEDGDIYAGGEFTQIITGIVPAYYIARWDGTNWNPIGAASGLNGVVDKIVVGPGNILYIGGQFDDVQGGGGGTYPHVIQYDPATDTFSALGAGLPSALANGGVYDLALDPTTGYLWAAHTVDVAGNLQGAVSYWDGAAWNLSRNFGTAIYVYTLSIDNNGNVYAGGEDDSIGLSSGLLYVNSGGWADAGIGLGDPVFDSVIGDDGIIYLCGSFTGCVVAYNRVSASILGGGISGIGFGSLPRVRYLSYENGNVYATGGVAYVAGAVAGTITTQVCVFSDSGRTQHFNSLAVWNGSIWVQPDISLNPTYPPPGASYIYPTSPVFFDRYGDLYLSVDENGSSPGNLVTPYVSSVLDIESVSSIDTYPTVEITTDATGILVWIKNETTGDTIYIDKFILPEDILQIDFEKKTVVSSATGNSISSILPGSQFSRFYVKPGLNRLTYFFIPKSGGTHLCRVWMRIRHGYSAGAMY